MFDGLFQEEGDDTPNTQSTNSTSTSSESAPHSPRFSCGLCGIYNQGATCYMNSLLQTLCMTPEFREKLFQLKSSELGQLKDKDKKNAKVRVIPIQLQRLFARLLLLNTQGVSTTELTDSFGWTNNEELVQHDVQELNRILFSAVEDSLIGTSGGSLIRDLYHGSVVNQITCLNCGRISEREEDFLDVCVAVSGSPGLETSLRQYYVETESLTGKNQYRCEACGKLVDAKKGAKIRHLPPILTVSLLRFSFDFRKMERIKETGKFIYPLEMDMADCVENLTTAGCTEYELFSVVIHSGGAHGGHYTAYIRDIDSLGNWVHPDKDEIQLGPDPASGQVDLIACDSPVELIKTILSRHPDKGMKVDNLCAALMNQTGISWNKRFKKQHGAINKFLKRHDDKFVVDADNFVTLNMSSGPGCSQDGPDTTQQGERNGETPRKRKTPKRPPSPDPADGKAWFYFNDNRVHAVRTKELESQYSGKTSAYMLFYRNKSLTRPDVAKHHREYMIPDNLLVEVSEENAKLEEDRIKHDLKINTIILKLLFPSFYVFQKGALQAKDDTFSCVEISIDRRKTVTELKQAIREMYEELCPSDIVMHTARILAAGVHLYSCVSVNEDTRIQELNISNRPRLFVWDGKQIDDQEIPIGPDCEPILLTITHGNSPSPEFSHAFSQSLTLGELRLMLCEMTGTELEGSGMSRVLTEGETTKLVRILPEDHGKTLEEADIHNGEQIVLESTSGSTSSTLAEKTLQQQSRQISFVIENRCKATIDGEWPMIRVEVDKESTVEELKAIILSRLSCEEDLDVECRLRCDHESLGLMPPLHEAQDLSSAGLKPGVRVVLEPGPAPLNDQMTLVVSPPGADKDSSNVEVIVERSMTVGDCLKLVIKTVDRTGDDWHLRKTNWCGEAADILDDSNATLAECQLKNGDHILLEEGNLPPRGYVKLHIFLYPSPNTSQSQQSGGIVSSILGSLQEYLGYSSDTTKPKSPVDLGHLVISRDATLEDLKVMILALPKMENVSLPMLEYLRLRIANNGRLTTVLKNHETTLLRLKLTNSTMLGVQILPREENLNQNHITLNILRRIPNTKTYSPPEELIWDTTDGATQPLLLSAIAETLSIPEDRLVIAKHFLEKYEWHKVLDKPKKQTKAKKNQKAKKPSTQKVSIRQSPYFIREGDDIGVKDLETDPNDEDDFTTEYDLEGKERLRQEAEERRKRREAAKRFNEEIKCMTVKQRQEVGIKIHVENFR